MKLTILFTMIFLATSCNTKEKTLVAATNTSKVIENAILHDTCQYLLKKLPNNFSDFSLLYGFDDKIGAGKYYNQYEKDLGEFFLCEKITLNQKLSKSIEIGINGNWDADAINMLQYETVKLVIKYPNETSKILNKLSDNKASSFWFFIIDGPHPADKEKVESYKNIITGLGVNSQQGKLLKEQGKKINIGL